MNIIVKIKRFIKKAFGMSDKNDEISWTDYVLAFISGAAIGYVLYKLISGGEEHFECPRCHNIFRGKQTNCPFCNLQLIW